MIFCGCWAMLAILLAELSTVLAILAKVLVLLVRKFWRFSLTETALCRWASSSCASVSAADFFDGLNRGSKASLLLDSLLSSAVFRLGRKRFRAWGRQALKRPKKTDFGSSWLAKGSLWLWRG